MANDFRTGVADEHFDLISVLYHALQDCEVLGKYAQDAEEAGDEELCHFFTNLQEDDRKRVDRTKDLLVRRINYESNMADAKVQAPASEIAMSETR